jgi:hypothetical protein
MNILSVRNVRPNRLMGVEITPVSHEIAEFLIKERQAFRDPSIREPN